MCKGPEIRGNVAYLEPEELDKRKEKVFECIRESSRSWDLQDRCPREKESILR